MRVVRDHDDGFAMLPVESLQKLEDFIARLAVQISGRFVTEQ